MLVKCLEVGLVMANCYLVWCEETKEALVIDPGGEAARILAEIKKEHLQVKYIVNTHGHMDHIAVNHEVKEGTGAKLLIHVEDAPLLENPNLNLSSYMGGAYRSPKPDLLLCEGEEIAVGKQVRLEVLHTPGHTRGGMSLKTDGAIFTGDTLFAGSVGRTDFPGGSFQELLESIKNKIMICDDSFLIYPGHGPTSTIGYERRHNPFL